MDSLYLLKYGILGTKKAINSVMNPESEKQLLDPMSSIIRLALLTFKGKNTKISISHNKIYFQPPNLLQGTIRWTYGDARDDLHNLCHTIEIATLWYDPKKDKNVENIFKFAIKGLNNLRESYLIKNAKIMDSNLVCHSIMHYISLLENSLKGSEMPEINRDLEKEFDIFKKIWNVGEIEIVNGLFLLAQDKKDKNEEYIYAVKAIDAIVQEKDNLLNRA